MEPTRIDVESATRTYPVFVAHGLAAAMDRWLSEAEIGDRRFLVSSPTVWARHGKTIQAALPKVDPLLVPDGERSKTLHTVSRIYEALIRAGADRQSTIVAVGGGVLGDTAGFAAATYLRGVDLVHVPTTLLAQVDSAVGGKVGVNHALGKNLIGAFHPPAAVIADPQLLDTLPRRELRAGTLRGRQVRGHRRPAALRPARGRPAPDLRAEAGAPRGHRCRFVPHQGRGGRRRRARGGPAAHPELRAHGRPRPRGGHAVPASPARRGGGVRHAGRGPACGRTAA